MEILCQVKYIGKYTQVLRLSYLKTNAPTTRETVYMLFTTDINQKNKKVLLLAELNIKTAD